MSPGKPARSLLLAGAMIGTIIVLYDPSFAQTSQTSSTNANCLLPGGVLDLACTLPGSRSEDPDVKRVNTEIDTIEAGTLAYVFSHTIDASHQMQYLGELEIFDKSLSVNEI